VSHSTPDSECTPAPPPKHIFHAAFVSTHRRSTRLLLRPRILLVPGPAPGSVLLESIKVAKTLDDTDTDTDASATPPRRRRASQSLFAPASLHISAAQCLYWAWPIATPLQPCCGPALRQTENTKLASTCRTPVAIKHQNLQPPTLMTDANIVITSLRHISHSFVLS
jgi:hypothetical protein